MIVFLAIGFIKFMFKMDEQKLDLSEGTDDSDHQNLNKLWQNNKGKAGFILGMGTASGAFNYEHGIQAMITAGVKQAGYSAVSAIILLRIYDYLAKRIKKLPGIYEFVPAVLPAIITILANYEIHNLKGTAEPMLSTLPTAVMAGIGFPIWHVRARLLECWDELEKMEIKL